MVGQQQVSFTERCALFGVSIIGRFHCSLMEKGQEITSNMVVVCW